MLLLVTGFVADVMLRALRVVDFVPFTSGFNQAGFGANAFPRYQSGFLQWALTGSHAVFMLLLPSFCLTCACLFASGREFRLVSDGAVVRSLPVQDNMSVRWLRFDQ